jgi:hypothetical protein
MDDEGFFGLEQMTAVELAALAASTDLWHNVPALAMLAKRAPDVALPVARSLLTADDELIAAEALSVLSRLDVDAAYAHMEEIAEDPPPALLRAMVEILAVDAPVIPDALPAVLEPLARRLESPKTGPEQDLAELLFSAYPHLRLGS